MDTYTDAMVQRAQTILDAHNSGARYYKRATLRRCRTIVNRDAAGKPPKTQPQYRPEPRPQHERCHDCGGSGIYFAGRIENGKRKGYEGTCYRCDGKGYQTPADVIRNRNYDNYYRRIAA